MAAGAAGDVIGIRIVPAPRVAVGGTEEHQDLLAFADPDTAELTRWLDVQAKRNTVLTFGGGVNEIQRELIATAGLGLPRVPR